MAHMKTIDIFPWNDHFKTGIEIIDTQHYQLITLLNRLATQVVYQASSEELEFVFDELTKYTVYHFETEENIWKQYLGNDPLDIEHHQVHQKFIDTIDSLKNKIQSGSLNEVANEALEFLAKWLVSHILETDRYMAYIVLGLKSGLELGTAKQEAQAKMDGANRILVDIILSIYSTLSSNTLQLMEELQLHQQYEQTIDYQDKYLQLLLELSSSFINLPLNQIDSQINKSLEEMALFTGTDRVYIFNYELNENTLTNTHEYCAEGIEPKINELQDVPMEFAVDWPEIHAQGKHVLIEDVKALPKGVLRDILLPQGIQSLVTFPLFENNICSGFVGFDAVKQPHIFTDMEINILNFFSKLLSSVSNRKTVEKQLEYERSVLKTLIHEIPDLIWLKNIDGVYLACNSRFEDFFGAKETEIVGKTDYDFVESSLADSFREHDNQALYADKASMNEEEIVFANDGHKEILQTTKLPIEDSQGKVIGILGVGRDITATRNFQNKLEEKESYQRALLDNFPFLIWLKDDQSRFLAVNKAFANASNFDDPDELVGKTDLDIWPEELAESYRQDDKNVLLSGKTKNVEELVVTSDEMVVMETYKSPVSINKNTIGTVGFARDITDKKEAEKKLHLAASVFTHSQEGIIITSAQNKIIEVNHAVESITGYSRDELIGKNPKILSSGQHKPDFYSKMWEKLKNTASWSGELTNRNKFGHIYTEMLTISAVKDDAGNIIHYVGLFTDISVLKEQQKHLEFIAHYDALTNLPNRVLLSDRMQQAMVYTRRNKSIVAIVYLDLDGFKEVNDTYGHDIGDKLLIIIADRMKKQLREGDTISRIGGDEFVAVLQGLKAKEDTTYMLNRLLSAASQPIRIEELQMQVSASLGVSFFCSEDSFSADQLLRFADQAMYQAKLKGKNCFHIFDAEEDANVRTQHENIEMIENALVNDEFVLYYQPKVNMRSGHVVGMEALIRWNHKTRGILNPGTFLPIVEGHSLSITIGELVLKKAFEQITFWKEQGLELVVSINIDALHLLDGSIVNYLKHLLETYPMVKAGNIELEILETSALEDMLKVTRIMEECKELGITFSLDDFGTGYSSLTYLKRLPASELKIDQSFVRDMLHDPDDLAILEGVIGLASAFRRSIIAEGVENLKQGRILLQLGCERAQGYIISRPMPAEKVQKWVEEWKPDKEWENVNIINREYLPLLYASVEHTSWVDTIIAFLEDKYCSPFEKSDTECMFGQWLASHEKEKYQYLPSFEDVKELHFNIHVCANRLISMKKSNVEIIESDIKELKTLSERLINVLDACQINLK